MADCGRGERGKWRPHEDHNRLVLRPRSLCGWREQRVCFLTFQSSDAVVFELAAVRVSGVAETMWAIPQAQVLHLSQRDSKMLPKQVAFPRRKDPRRRCCFRAASWRLRR